LNLNSFILPSSIERFVFNGQMFYIKRDDQISPYFSGNKFRKLHYYLEKDLSSYHTIVSYGGLQSNAMLSIASLAKLKGLDFTYYSKSSNKSFENQEGNIEQALALGMRIYYVDHNSDEEIRVAIEETIDDKTLFIPQGGASKEAHFGIETLAKEILTWQKDTQIDNLVVITPSGTGTTALFLENALSQYDIKVVTTACVGDEAYLKEQMTRTEKKATIPQILCTENKYPFAKPKEVLYQHYMEVFKQGIELDLIYAPVMLQAFKEHQKEFKDSNCLYIHSGGVSGNVTQLKRYQKIIDRLLS
jgi:1-aminocyclopropane-1-carboxylate deaminase